MHEEQIRHGTFREQLLQLQGLLKDVIGAGAAEPKDYEATLVQLLKSVEAIRVKNESEMHRLREQIRFHEATLKTCSIFSNMLINIVSTRRNEALRAHTVKLDERALMLKGIEEDETELVDLIAGGQKAKARKLRAEIEKKKAAYDALWQADQEKAAADAPVVPVGSKAEKDMISKSLANSLREEETVGRKRTAPVKKRGRPRKKTKVK